MRVRSLLRLLVTVISIALLVSACGDGQAVRAKYPPIPPSSVTDDWTPEQWNDLFSEALEVAEFNGEDTGTGRPYQGDPGDPLNEWEHAFDTAYEKYLANQATTQEQAESDGTSEAATDDGGSPGTTAGAAEPPPDRTDCKLSHTDAAIPSIGRTGKSAVATGLVPDTLDSYEVGLAIRERISDGELCPEHLVELYNDNDPPGVLSPEMQAAIEAVVAEMSGSGG